MARGITVTLSTQTVIDPTMPTYAITVTASNGVNMDTNIFRIRQRPLNPLTNTTTTSFDGVCTPADMASLPIGAPIAPGILFRLSSASFTYNDQNDGNTGWINIQAQVQALINGLKAGDILGIQQIISFS